MKKLYHGSCYYPELWPEADLERDIAEMQRLGLNYVRIGEFAWSKMEPDEGRISMGEQLEAARTLVRIQPGRKLSAAKNPGDLAREDVDEPDHAGMGFGTDWGAISSAWLTQWERTGDPKMRDRLVASMTSIAAQPHGFFTGASSMNLTTGEFDISKSDRISVSHLSAVFVQQGHARLTAYAAAMTDDAALGERAWKEFRGGAGGIRRREMPEAKTITGPAVLRPVDEAAFVSTNGTAQWGLAAIECLALAGDELGGN